MKFTIAAAIAGLAATVAAGSNDTYITEVLTAYTTYCPEATQITHNGKTYTITEATTLTITDCPCTVTKPVYTSVATSCSTCTPSAPAYSAPAYTAPAYTSSAYVSPVYPSKNATAPAYTPKSTGTGAYTPPASTSPIAPAYTGAASQLSFGVAGMLAAAGLVAAL